MDKEKSNKIFWGVTLLSQALILVLYGLFFENIIEFNPIDIQANYAAEVTDRLYLLKETAIIVFVILVHSSINGSESNNRQLLLRLVAVVLALQFYFLWAQLWVSSFYASFSIVRINMMTLIEGIFCAAAAVVASVPISDIENPNQFLFILATFTLIYSLNEAICFYLFRVTDTGRGITAFLYGSSYGLVAEFVLKFGKYKKSNSLESKVQEANNQSFDLFMALLTFICFPIFNSVSFGSSVNRDMGVLNTYFALFSSVIGCAGITAFFKKESQFGTNLKMATLAAGVAVSSYSASLDKGFWGFLVGLVIGTGSVVGSIYFPKIEEKIKTEMNKFVIFSFFVPAVINSLLSILFRGIFIDDESKNQTICVFITLGFGLFFGFLMSILSKLIFKTDPKNEPTYAQVQTFKPPSEVTDPNQNPAQDQNNSLDESNNKPFQDNSIRIHN